METGSISRVEFDVLSDNIGVVEVTKATSKVFFDKNNTLHDIRMGCFKNIPCQTCGGDENTCEGHFGSHRFKQPILNPCFVDLLLKPLLKVLCVECLRMNCECKQPETTKKRKLDISKHFRVESESYFTNQNRGVKFVVVDQGGDVVSIKKLYDLLVQVPPSETKHVFPKFENRRVVDLVFIHSLPILPISARPPNLMNGSWVANSITLLYSKVIRSNFEVKSKWNQPEHVLDEAIQELQHDVNVLFDTNNTSKSLGGYLYNNGGIRNRLDGKQGRLRLNLMGKRCNFSARTVLSGDPKLKLNEVGIPKSIANDLTVPVIVNKLNIDKFKVSRNIKYLKKKDGALFDIKRSPHLIHSMEIGDTVDRYLQNGDVVIINRQPTLHRGSMMAAYVRIFECSTFRLNYSTMVPLNADTDGDEINIHVPQDLSSRAELEELMTVDNSIVSNQSSKPLIGLTQDSLLGCYLMGKATFDEQVWGDIMMSTGIDDSLVSPCIIKPRKLWSGTRVVEAVLKHIGWDYDLNTDLLHIEGDHVVRAVLNKKTLGATSKSLVHYVFLLYGAKKAAEFIHLMQLAATSFLDYDGFSIGISDCTNRIEIFNYDGLEDMLPPETENEEKQLVSALQNILVMEPYDEDDVETNRLLAMIDSGSKGSIVNYNQIKRAVCQQIVNGKRVEKEIQGYHRYFPHMDGKDRLESRGFVRNSFIKGLTPIEFFTHAKSSRISLVDTACKTATTGYLQRKLTKNTENIVCCFDGTIRNNIDNQVVQFNFGRDSVDPMHKM